MIDPSLLSRVIYVTSSPYNAPMNGADDDKPAIQAVLDELTSNGGVVVVPGSPRLNSALRLRPNVSLLSMGPTKCIWDCRKGLETDGSGPVIYADEPLQGVTLAGFQVGHANNPYANVDGIVLKRGFTDCKLGSGGLGGKGQFWFVGKAGVTRNGIVVYGANPATGIGNNSLYGCQFNVRITATLTGLITGGATMITGMGLQLGELTNIVNARANSHILRGVVNNFSTGVFSNGQSIDFGMRINTASVIGWHLKGDEGCYGNSLGPPAYFDSGIAGDKVQIENTANRAVIMLTAQRCTGIHSEADIVEVDTGGYKALKIFEGEIFVTTAPPSLGVGIYWPAGTVFTNRARYTEAGTAGSK